MVAIINKKTSQKPLFYIIRNRLTRGRSFVGVEEKEDLLWLELVDP